MRIENGFHKKFKEETLVQGVVTASSDFSGTARGSVTITFHVGDKSCTAVLSPEEARRLALDILRQEDNINECERKLWAKQVTKLEDTIAELKLTGS